MMTSVFVRILFFSLFMLLPTVMRSQSLLPADTLRLMTYNIRNTMGMDGTSVNLERVAMVIRRYHPDVVAIQEVDSMTERSGRKPILNELARLTFMHGEFAPAINFDGGKYGIGILSRNQPLSVCHYPLPGNEEARCILVAEFTNFIFACTHLSLTESDRFAAMSIIQKIACQAAKPFVLAGDFNDHPDSPLMEAWSNTFDVISGTAHCTYPAYSPDELLDYILLHRAGASGGRSVRTFVPNEPKASDHRPVIADVVFD